MRDITIHKVVNGYTAHVGCQELVFETASTLLVELGRYLQDPEKVEAEYCAKYQLTAGGAPAPVPPSPRTTDEYAVGLGAQRGMSLGLLTSSGIR